MALNCWRDEPGGPDAVCPERGASVVVAEAVICHSHDVEQIGIYKHDRNCLVSLTASIAEKAGVGKGGPPEEDLGCQYEEMSSNQTLQQDLHISLYLQSTRVKTYSADDCSSAAASGCTWPLVPRECC